MSMIHTKPATKEYRSNWDKVYKKKCKHPALRLHEKMDGNVLVCEDCGAVLTKK
jgi:hypothetical protein